MPLRPVFVNYLRNVNIILNILAQYQSVIAGALGAVISFQLQAGLAVGGEDLLLAVLGLVGQPFAPARDLLVRDVRGVLGLIS
jgi:hypothetical protein